MTPHERAEQVALDIWERAVFLAGHPLDKQEDFLQDITAALLAFSEEQNSVLADVRRYSATQAQEILNLRAEVERLTRKLASAETYGEKERSHFENWYARATEAEAENARLTEAVAQAREAHRLDVEDILHDLPDRYHDAYATAKAILARLSAQPPEA